MTFPNWFGSPVRGRRGRAARPRLEALEDRSVPATLTVTSAADRGPNTLRAAITAANQLPGPDTIDFAIGATGSAQSILLTSALPTITSTVILDGTSQGGSGYAGTPLIALIGTRAGLRASGLVLTGSGSMIQGLNIQRFAQDGVLLAENASGNLIGGTAAGEGNVISGNGNHGVELVGPGVTGNIIAGNSIGTNAAGTTAFGNRFDGVLIRNGASGNTIGGSTAGSANVISTNGRSGVEVVNAGTSGNLILGNFIGTNVSGTTALGNRYDGVFIRAGASGNTVGGTAAGEGNVISGNANHGVEVANAGTTGNLILGNLIGTNATGAVAIANRFDGVLIRTGASGNTVGGTAAGSGNVISGNGNAGVEVVNAGTTGNVIAGNFIGTNASGAAAVGNRFDGVLVRTGASGNTVGGTAAGSGNVISGNGFAGVEIVGPGTVNNLVQGNWIGTGAGGTGDLGNAANGVAVRDRASRNTIGGTVAGAGNVIAFNGGNGVLIGDNNPLRFAGTGNAIQGNSIFENDRLGIFLGFDNLRRAPVVLANDSVRHRPLNNAYQNYPVLATPVQTATGTTLSGTISSPNNPGTSLRIEFFSSPTADPSGHGEGATFLGAVTVTSNASGVATFTFDVPFRLTSGEVISATATDVNGNTSAFSRDVIVP